MQHRDVLFGCVELVDALLELSNPLCVRGAKLVNGFAKLLDLVILGSDLQGESGLV